MLYDTNTDILDLDASVASQCVISCQEYPLYSPNQAPINHTMCIPKNICLYHFAPYQLAFLKTFLLSLTGTGSATSLRIDVQVNPTTTISDMGRFWLIPSPANPKNIDLTLEAIPGSQLLPGQHIQGFVGFSLRKVLTRSILEIMGILPVSVPEKLTYEIVFKVRPAELY